MTRTSETVDELAMSCVALEDMPQATFSGFVKRLRPKTKGIAYDRFMAFYLRSKYFRKIIDSNTIMTLRASFNEDMFSYINLYLPDYETQVKIGDLFFNFDRKISLNASVSATLEQMSYDLYMHTFYGRKCNGALGDIIIENGKSDVQVGEAKGCSGSIPFYTSGDAVLRWDEPMVSGRNCFLNTGGNADIKFYVGAAAYSTDTWCIAGKGEISEYLYALLKSIKPEISQKFFRGTGLRHLQKPMLKDRPIYIPTQGELQSFNHCAQPWLAMISRNTRESNELTSLRDWLLPMLMNGQVTL